MLTVTYKPSEPDHPAVYVAELNDFAKHIFNPAELVGESLIDKITSVMVGTRSTRVGPSPRPEGMVKIREVIRYYVEQRKPIQVLVPFGPTKPSPDRGVDMAELAALRTLDCLQKQVTTCFSPGLHFVIRLEDTTGRFLEFLPGFQDAISRYCYDFIRLVRVLDMGHFITPIMESDLVLPEIHKAMSHEMAAHFYDAIETGDSTKLYTLGWNSGVPKEMIEFLLDKYKHLYPDYPSQHFGLVTKYLGGTLARHILGARGLPADTPCLHINFAQIMAGAPKETTDHRLYLRTVPVKHSKLHVPPWRGFGTIRMRDDGICYKIWPWGSQPKDLFEGSYVFSNSEDSVKVRADYYLED